MTIYVDVVLLENICMNYIILFSTSYIIKIKRKHIRLFLSSLVGAVYAVLAYAEIVPLYANLIVKVILSIVMVYIAFYPKNFKGLLKELIVFYLVSFALGGCAFALLYIVRPQDIFIKNGVYIGTYPIKIALLGGIVGFIVTYIAFKVVKNKIVKNQIIYEVEISIEDKTLKTRLLLDTGNMLKDPISNSPVLVVEKNILKEIIPAEVLEETEKILGGDVKRNEKYQKRLRIIPFSSIGKQNGIMIGIKADKVKVTNDIEEIINQNAIICPYDKKMSKQNRYFGLVGPEMLDVTEEKDVNIDEYFTDVKK